MNSADLLTIGVFGRLVGLTPSALRFYDDCGLLRPREIDPQTGYRYYGRDQHQAAILLRRTRELELPLAQAAEVLAGPPARAAEILRGHAAGLGARAERMARVAAELIASLDGADRVGSDGRPGPEAGTAVEVVGPELAAAIRQVGTAAGRPESPGGRGVLLELDEAGSELSVVAGGDAWLAVRTLTARVSGTGSARRLAIGPTELGPVVGLARRADLVVVRFGSPRWPTAEPVPAAGVVRAAGADLTAGSEGLRLTRVPDLHPSHRVVFAELAPWRSRVIMDRRAADEALRSVRGSARLVIDHDQVEFHPAEFGAAAPARVPAVCRGASMTIAFAVDVLGPALESGIGPDVLLELAGPDRPALIRSADQGSFTVLIMPQLPVS
ncbi:MerR family transcriptional regulator [Microlunatus speluncae]|uniref:MerR family transcriptional regulator n=1 Tax=Microlunatus speluncae TaxID=2594267 RepID=UPI00126660AE|nr:MerR family transcriptional regulator [Microlunatus speluncae]